MSVKAQLNLIFALGIITLLSLGYLASTVMQ